MDGVAAPEPLAERQQRRCMRCDQMTRYWLCNACAADEIADHEREDEYAEGPDFAFDCGMMSDGTCMLAGTEDCDWECPRNRPAPAHSNTTGDEHG